MGSALSATVLLAVIAGLAAASVGGLRALGITRDHPWIRQMASRPWRDGQDVLEVAMRHLSDVFVVTPGGSLLAPNVVELQLSPDDLSSLCERMELGVISASMVEVYEEQVAAYGTWVLRLRLDAPATPRAEPAVPDDGKQLTTRAGTIVRRSGEPGEDAAAAWQWRLAAPHLQRDWLTCRWIDMGCRQGIVDRVCQDSAYGGTT